jgi:Asp-tRNA(Asn)/Glu-tRNA(Gln) amidotransferase A subunit family amidase
MPALTVPAGRAANGLPLGLQMVGRYGMDELLLSWAAMVVARVPEPADVEG